MKSFIGREEEQKTINYLLDREGYQGCVIYGRRRMGKTELVKHCLEQKNIPQIFFQCEDSTEEENVYLLNRFLEQSLNIRRLDFSHFFDAIDYVFELSCEKDIALIIDEYPNIRNLIKGCDSKLQYLIDKYSSKCHLKLFILGSFISTMKDIMDGEHPLYMRFNQTIVLKQMDYYESSLFYPSMSLEDKVLLYSVLGGCPYFNTQVDEKQSVKNNIIRIISGRQSNFKEFIEVYLRSELRKINNANVVFESIALGAFHYTDILNKTHLESSALLNLVLKSLMNMDLIEKVYPINEPNNKTKSGYRITDNSLAFYYNFIYRNRSFHSLMPDSLFYDTYIKNKLEQTVVPHVFENITKEYLVRCNGVKTVTPLLVGIGKYWYDDPINHTNGEFDVVGQTDEGYIFFECKYTDTPITDSIIKEEIIEVGKTTLKAYQYGFVSKVGFNLKNKYNYIFITLEDMYK